MAESGRRGADAGNAAGRSAPVRRCPTPQHARALGDLYACRADDQDGGDSRSVFQDRRLSSHRWEVSSNSIPHSGPCWLSALDCPFASLRRVLGDVSLLLAQSVQLVNQRINLRVRVLDLPRQRRPLVIGPRLSLTSVEIAQLSHEFGAAYTAGKPSIATAHMQLHAPIVRRQSFESSTHRRGNESFLSILLFWM
jgi:hypothetical protein